MRKTFTDAAAALLVLTTVYLLFAMCSALEPGVSPDPEAPKVGRVEVAK